VRNIKWVAIGVLGAVVWLEVFIVSPVASVLLIVAAAGWWDYQRRRARLRPPGL
jgi:hypothetical protein